MAAANVAVIYGANSKLVLRIIIADDERQYQALTVLKSGEALLAIPMDEFTLLRGADAVMARVAREIGEPLHNGRCAVVDDTGRCVAVITADPDVYRGDPRYTLEVNQSAAVGEVKVNGVFPTRPIPAVPDDGVVVATPL